MAQAAPSIDLTQVPTHPAPVRSAAWGLAWTVLTPALRVLGRALASGYEAEARRPAARRSPR